MGFWDRFRREGGGASASASGPASRFRRVGGGPSAPASASRDTAVREPGQAATPQAPAGRPDWDGGWREVAPAPVTIARSPLGVSDGLRFRSGLAAWQNPTLTTDLGHGLLPSAPTGLIHGVARPTTTPRPTPTEGGGPLLLRAVDSAPDPEPAEAGPAGGPERPIQRAASDPLVASGRTGGSQTPTPERTAPRRTTNTRDAAPERGGPGGPAMTVPLSGATHVPASSDPLVVSRRTGAGTPVPERAEPGGPAMTVPVSGATHVPAASDPLVVSRRTGAGTPVPERAEPGGPAMTAPVLGAGPAAPRPVTGGDGPSVVPAASDPLVVSRRTGAETPDNSAAPARPADGSGAPATPHEPGRADANRPAALPVVGAAPQPSDAGAPTTGPAPQTPESSATPRRTRPASPVRPRPVGAPMVVARRPAMAPRVLAAVPPRSPATAADRATTPSPDGNPVREEPARAEGPDRSPRTATRPGLGAPLGELPSTARQIGSPTVTNAPTPAQPLPVMRRTTEPESPSGPPPSAPGPTVRKPTTRSGLGAPLRELPPTATRAPASTPAAPLLGGDAPVQRSPLPSASTPARPRTPDAPPTGPTPVVPLSRAAETTTGPSGAPAHGTPGTSAGASPVAPADASAPGATPLVPVSRAAERTSGTSAPGSSGSSSAGSASAAPVQRAVERTSGASGTSTPGASGGSAGSTPPTPVQRAAGRTSGASGTSTPGSPTGSTPSTPVQRAAEKTSDPTGTPTPSASDGSSAEATPVVPLARPADARPEPLVPVARAVEKPAAPSTAQGAGKSPSGPTDVDARTPASTTPARGDATPRTPLHVSAATGASPGAAPAVTPFVQSSRRLLADRPLVVSTGAAEGFSAPPSAAGASRRPVVAASWRRDPAPGTPEGPADPSRTPAPAPAPAVQRSANVPTPPGRGLLARLRPAATNGSPNGSTDQATSPGTPMPVSTPPAQAAVPAPAPVQRSSAPGPAAALAASPARAVIPAPAAPPARAVTPAPAVSPAAAAPPAPPVPLVRLDPSPTRPATGETASTPVQRQAQPLTYTRGAGPATGPEPVRPPVSPGTPAGSLQAKAVQRMADAGLSGVPVTRVTPVQRADSATEKTAATTPTPTKAASPSSRSQEIEELARQLIDPVARLLRAEMRRGRERTGRPYDGRR
ncbi:hypothetical protein [Streptomyces sp. NPDC054975]